MKQYTKFDNSQLYLLLNSKNKFSRRCVHRNVHIINAIFSINLLISPEDLRNVALIHVGHLDFQNEHKNIPREEIPSINIPCKFPIGSIEAVDIDGQTITTVHTCYKFYIP